MVELSAQLDLTFSALADPTRRRILEMLLHQERRVTEIAQSFTISLAAVSKHLRVLERAGLLARRRDGRVHHLRAKPEAVHQAQAWIEHYAQGWNEGFDALGRFLDTELHDAQAANTANAPHKKGSKNT